MHAHLPLEQARRYGTVALTGALSALLALLLTSSPWVKPGDSLRPTLIRLSVGWFALHRTRRPEGAVLPVLHAQQRPARPPYFWQVPWLSGLTRVSTLVRP